MNFDYLCGLELQILQFTNRKDYSYESQVKTNH